MSRILKTRRAKVLGVAMAAMAIAAVAAFAYFTAGGNGDGTATTQGTQTPLTVNQTSTLTAMYPGDLAQSLHGTFNNTNSGPTYVGSVTATIASVAKAADAPDGTCDASDFTLANPVAVVNAEVPVGSGKGTWTGPSIQFNDKTTTNQDACKGATVNLHYVIG